MAVKTSAQKCQKKWTVTHKRFNEKVHCRVFPEGLRAFVIPKPRFTKSFAVLATRYGSIDMEFSDPIARKRLKTPAGIAHFLEHQLFETEQGNASAFFAALGANVNAYTSYTSTAYHFTTTERFEECLGILLDLVMVPHFLPENVDKERGIIESELRGYMDSAGWRNFHNLTRALFKKHPVRIDTGGTVASIKKINAPLLTRCHEIFYHPGNLTLAVCGNHKPEKVFKQVGQFLKKLAPPPYRPAKRFYPTEPKQVSRKKISEKLKVSQPRLLLGFKDNRNTTDGKTLAKKVVVSRILLDLLFSRSAPAFTELYETELIDDSFSAGTEIDSGYGFAFVGGNTPNPNALTKRLHEIIENARRTGFSRSDFARIKSKLLGSSIRYFNAVESLANWQMANSFIGLSMFDYLRILEKVTGPDVEKMLKTFLKPETSSASIILPS